MSGVVLVDFASLLIVCGSKGRGGARCKQMGVFGALMTLP